MDAVWKLYRLHWFLPPSSSLKSPFACTALHSSEKFLLKNLSVTRDKLLTFITVCFTQAFQSQCSSLVTDYHVISGVRSPHWKQETVIDTCFPQSSYRLFGLVVKASSSRTEDLGFKSCLRWDFSRSSHTSDLKIGTPVATLPGTWHYRVSAGTGWSGVSILWLGKVESLICNFYLSVAARKNCKSRSVPEIH